MKKITNIDTLKIGAEIFDENGELCHIKDITLKGSISTLNTTHQLHLFPLIGVSELSSWYEDQESYIHEKVMINPQDHIITVQHYPSSKWYKAEVKCDKCGGISTLTNTTTTIEKFVCTHKIPGIPKGQLFPIESCYTCGGKKYTEIKRRSTGITCVNIYSCSDFIKTFKIIVI